VKLSGTSPCAMGGSDDSNSVTAPASNGDRATMSSSVLVAGGESLMEREKSGECDVSVESVEEQMEQSEAHWSVLAESGAIEEEQESDYWTASESDDATESKLPFMSALEEEIERSKAHWSTLADQSGSVESEDEEEEEAEVSNVELFKALQWHPTWGGFFQTFGYEFDESEYFRLGELELGEKFAEGGQAELYNAHVTSRNPEYNERDLRDGREYAVKIFKGTFLKHLLSQLPQGLLQFHVEDMENLESLTPECFPKFFCTVLRGILLKNGRFAFLMEKDHYDLRNLIERQMGSISGNNYGLFPKEEAELIMYDVALGVNWLHSRGIIHRHLKASNVLVRELHNGWPKWHGFVADYECSVGVVGTRFFRAPKILQACKDGTASWKSEVFSTTADAYSFGMTCYEILTGKLPFEDYPFSVSTLIDLVINQHLRPEVPKYVENWACELLRMCWQCDPIARPSFGEILDLLSTNSTIVRRREDERILEYGQNYRNWHYNEIPNSCRCHVLEYLNVCINITYLECMLEVFPFTM
jgi:serine/threonine protein kinase